MTQERYTDQKVRHPSEEPSRSVQSPPKIRAVWGLTLSVLVGIACMVITIPWPAVSPLLLAILFGIAWSNTVGMPVVFTAGIGVSAKMVLRIGIVLLGLQISLGDILDLGWGMILVAISVVALGFVTTFGLGRMFGLSSNQSLLIASGFSICGAAAVAGAEGVVNARKTEVATALALVVLFGTLMIPAIPLVAELIGLDSETSGLWAGAVTHEVAQVVAIGGIIGGSALSLAVIVKLCRVLMLAPVMALLSIRQRKTASAAGGKRPPLIPMFVIGFLIAVAVKTANFLPTGLLEGAGLVQTVLLSAAMFALGCGVRFSELKKVGPAPVLVGAISTVVVAGIGLAGVSLVGIAAS